MLPSRHTLLAVVALAAAMPAGAATITLDIPGCSNVAVSGTGPNYSITCAQPAQTCIVNATPSSPPGNSAATLTAACTPTATSLTWQASRDCTTPTPVQGSPLTATVIESGGRSCVYTATADGSGTGATTVVWQGPGTQPPANAPTGCSITRTPANGALASSGGAISMAGACSGGGAVTSWRWRKNATTNWSTAQSPTDTLPANAGASPVTYTYGLVACAGTACASEVTTTFTVAATSTNPVGFCTGDSRYADLAWGGGGAGYVTAPPAGVGIDNGTTFVGKIVVPASGYRRGLITASEYGDGAPVERVASLASAPCDFRNFVPNPYGVLPEGNQSQSTGPLAYGGGTSPNISFTIAPLQEFGKPMLQPGQTYYFSIRSIRLIDGQSSCPGTCNMIVTVNPS